MDEYSDRELFVQDVNWIVFVLLIVILSVIDLFILLLPIERGAKGVILVVAVLINIIFWIDSFYWLRRLPDRRFLTDYYGRLSFVGNIPIFAPLRLLQIYLFYKKLHKLGVRPNQEIQLKRNSQGILLSFLFVAIVIFQTAGVFVLIFESANPEANIITSGDALWWSLVTVATVGYGDMYPVTTGGRITALFLMVIGIGLFGIFTSSLGNWFRRPRRNPDSQTEKEDENRAVTVAELRQLLEQQSQTYQKSIAELAEKLNELEKE